MSKAAELAALIGSQSAQSNRNVIINGAMQVAQRGTSTASISSSNTFVLDRTRLSVTNGGTWTMSQSTTVPSGQGFSHSLKVDCTTADTSLGSSDFLLLQQLIEGQNAQHFAYGTSGAKSVVVSFWIRSNKTGTYTLEVQQQDSSNAFYQNAKAFTISSADTWEKKEITFVGNTSNNIINSNAVGFYVTIWLGTGSSRTSGTFTNGTWHNTTANRIHSSQVNLADSTSNELYLTGMSLELGEQATPFEHRSFGDELARCQRYYQRITATGGSNHYVGTLQAYNSSNVFGLIAQYIEPLRTKPTVGQSVTFKSSQTASADTGNATIDNFAGSDVGWMTGGWGGGTYTAGNAAITKWTENAYLEADAEL